MTNNKFSKLFGHPVRDPKKDLLTQFHMDIAASIQFVIEKIVLRITKIFYLSIKSEFLFSRRSST